MIDNLSLTEIGRFQRTHALQGELNAILDYDCELLPDYPLFVVMDGIPVPFFAESVRSKGASAALVKLEGIDSVEEAAAFVNKPILMEEKSLKDFYGDDFEVESDVIGYNLIDSRSGTIGEIADIDDSTENVLMTVVAKDGAEYYIPAVDEWIVEIDDDAHTVTMTLPEGILDINNQPEL